MENYRFSHQENQYFGECLPCSAAQFKNIVCSAIVDYRITTRQAVDEAIGEGQPLDRFTSDNDFQKFCKKELSKPRTGEVFAGLTLEQQLLQWTNSLKSSLPCLIYGVKDFAAVPKLDKVGNPVLDDKGQPVLFRRRLQQNIKELSCLFMFDGDHLPIDPREVFERTRREGFPWEVRLAHATSSGHGIRLVCEARADVGNIADNQIELARELGLLGMLGTTGKPVVDDSCIDASRISYAPRMQDIYYIDEEHLFNPKTL